MSPPFRFAFQARKLDDPIDIAATAQRAEHLGYQELFSSDHFGLRDPFIPLVVAALATERIGVGPLVLNNEFHQPALLARTAATVDRLTGGRLVLGLGTGYMQAEHDAIGHELRPPGLRVTRFGETLEVLRSLLDDGHCHFDGDHHHVAVDDLGIKPVQRHVRFLVGGHGQRVVSLAARHADIFQFTGLTHDESGVTLASGFELSDVLQRKRWLEEAAGDRLNEIECSALVQYTYVGNDAAKKLPELIDDFSLSAESLEACPLVLVGSLEQVIDKLGRLREQLGISHVVIRDLEGFAPVVKALTGH